MMNRRNFLKFIAGSAVVAATGLPETLKAVPVSDEEFTRFEPNSDEAVYGMMREIISYDLPSDSIIVRHDIFTGNEQFGVDSEIYENSEDELEKARRHAAALLHNHLVSIGYSAKDLKRIPTIDEQLANYGIKLVIGGS